MKSSPTSFKVCLQVFIVLMFDEQSKDPNINQASGRIPAGVAANL
jgi:hypothetical protein